MPPSQLKRLKASLREQGIVGPQKSKKQKKQNAQSGANKEKRIQRTAALNGIREKFNPFEFKTSARGPKFDVTSNRTGSQGRVNIGKARPGVTKGLSEENRRNTLLLQMQRRNKVGGIFDRRFGEDDSTMAPEDKMLERFTQEKQRRHQNRAAFDLEDEDGPGELTHLGQSLSLDGPMLADDFHEDGLVLSDADNHSSDTENDSRKRRRESPPGELKDEADDIDGQPERKKTKQEVMKEVIAKSKLFKYERQAAKDDDEDLREELDKEMGEIHALLREGNRSTASKPADMTGLHPDRAAFLSGTEKLRFEKEYDLRLRQLAQDKKSKPTVRTKTEEERLAEESRKLQELEAQRLRRMQGEPEEEEQDEHQEESRINEAMNQGGEEDFGLGAGIKPHALAPEMGVEEEDDFVIDDDLVASGSDVGTSDDDVFSEPSKDTDAEGREFLNRLLTDEETTRPNFLTGANGPMHEIELPAQDGVNNDLAYTYSCPQSHDDMLEITKKVAVQDLPIVVRRIRALYDTKLKSENKTKLGNFTVSLIEHISYLANQSQLPPFDVLENLIRHVHSLAKTYPTQVANTFRKHLATQSEMRALAPTSGDLILLSAIGTVFPTSDHFHQVVTPAILSMAQYIGRKVPHVLSEYATGQYIITLCLQYQRLSRRFVPEIMGFLLNTMCALCPYRPTTVPPTFPYHESKLDRFDDSHNVQIRKLAFSDTKNQRLERHEQAILTSTLLETSIRLVDATVDMWTGKPAFQEIMEPALNILQHLGGKGCNEKLPKSTQSLVLKTSLKLNRVLKHEQRARRSLELHHHRPLAIKTSIPKFEESFNPDKHYDPDRERAETSKLRAEHKREMKGAMRELRKDANFIARESLREKKEKDAAYEMKYKRLVAEIQGEEGKEAKAYAKEKEFRKKGRKRS